MGGEIIFPNLIQLIKEVLTFQLRRKLPKPNCKHLLGKKTERKSMINLSGDNYIIYIIFGYFLYDSIHVFDKTSGNKYNTIVISIEYFD